MNISIAGYSFFNTFKTGKMDIFGYLETVKYRYRIDEVDLWSGFFSDESNEISVLADETYIKKIREALDEKEMTVVNFAIDGAHLWDPDKEKRELLYQNALKYLHASEVLGAKTVRIDTGGPYGNAGSGNFSSMSDEQFDYTVEKYREYSQRAADFGARLGPENHMGPSLNPHLVKKLAEAIDHPNFGFLLHMGRWKVDPETGDSIVAPWVYHVHFDGRTVVADDAEEKVRMLNAAGYQGYWGMEYNAPKDQYLEMEWALANMKKVLQNAAARS